MNALTVVILIFSVVGAGDYLLGNKLGFGKEFEKGFQLLGVMALAMIGMIVIAPWLGTALSLLFDGFYKAFKIDPSIIPASLFANDMGGAPLATQVAKDTAMGNFNGLVVSSMMGATVSFTIPFALGLVGKEKHKLLAFGLLSGVVTIPVGCFVAGLICKLPIGALLLDLLPLTLLAAVIAVGLLFCPDICVKIFKAFGFFIKALVLVGLMLGIVNFLAGETWIEGLGAIEEGTMVCMNASVVMTGMFPLVHLLSKVLKKPMQGLGKRLKVNEISVMGILSSLATSVPTFGVMNDMDDRGVVMNAAFAVSGAFTFAGHLAFTMAFNAAYLLLVIVGKLVAGASALALAYFLYVKTEKRTTEGSNA